MTSQSKGAAMAWFAKKEPVNTDSEIQATAEVLPQREQAIRDLMRFFQERGTSVPDAVRYSALFVGFAVANLMSVKGMAEADSEAQQLMKLARDAIDEGIGAVRAARDSEIGRTLSEHRYI
jgi:S-methylmethionine-dependent homocysteine/selenocysteine methylase